MDITVCLKVLVCSLTGRYSATSKKPCFESGKILLVTVTASLELSPCFINVPLNSSKCLYIIQIAGNTIYLLLYLICFSLKYSRCTSHPIRKSFVSKEPFIQVPCWRIFSAVAPGPLGSRDETAEVEKPCSPYQPHKFMSKFSKFLW